MSRVLIVAAHPDDAELAAGGTISLLADQGIEVLVAFLTVSDRGEEARRLRTEAAARSAKVLGHSVRWLADGVHDQVEDVPTYRIVGWIDELVTDFAPTSVLTHTTVDSHTDHVRTGEAVIASSRRWPHASLYQFPPNEHRTVRHQQFVPNTYVPIADQLPRKLRALSEYDYAGAGFRSLDTNSVRLQAAVHGASVGVEAAEAFQLIRQRVDSIIDSRCAAPTPTGEL